MASDGGTDEAEWPEVTGKVVAAGAGAVAGLPFGPVGAVAGAMAGPVFELFAVNIMRRVGQAGKRRSGEVLAVACEDAGFSSEQEVLGLIEDNEKLELLAGAAIAAATRTVWEDKVRTLGKSLAVGLLTTDDAKVDVEQLIMSAVSDIEAPHLALLDLLVAWSPPQYYGQREPIALDIPKYSVEHGDVWRPRERKWSFAAVQLHRPRLVPVFTSLIGTLQRHGLVAFEDNSDKEIKQLEKAVAAEASRRDQEQRSGKSQRRPSSAFRVKPINGTWEPTELGEQVWLRFHVAGANVSATWNEPSSVPQSAELGQAQDAHSLSSGAVPM